MALWPLKELGCPSTCAEVAQGSQSYHGIGVPQDTKEMWGSLFLKGSECSPCTKGSLAPCPAPQGIGGPPLYRSHVETPGPPPCPIWELQCPHKGKVGSLSACPVLFGNGVRGVPLPVLYGT